MTTQIRGTTSGTTHTVTALLVLWFCCGVSRAEWDQAPCDGTTVTIAELSGNITNPGYPAEYPDITRSGYNCLWQIQPPKGMTLKWRFLELSLPNRNPDDCVDYIGIQNIKATEVFDEHCGQTELNKKQSFNDAMYLKVKLHVTGRRSHYTPRKFKIEYILKGCLHIANPVNGEFISKNTGSWLQCEEGYVFKNNKKTVAMECENNKWSPDPQLYKLCIAELNKFISITEGTTITSNLIVNTTNASSGQEQSYKYGMIAGIVVGVLTLGVIAAISICLYKRKKKTTDSPRQSSIISDKIDHNPIYDSQETDLNLTQTAVVEDEKRLSLLYAKPNKTRKPKNNNDSKVQQGLLLDEGNARRNSTYANIDNQEVVMPTGSDLTSHHYQSVDEHIAPNSGDLTSHVTGHEHVARVSNDNELVLVDNDLYVGEQIGVKTNSLNLYGH